MSTDKANEPIPNFEIITFRLNEVEKNLERDISKVLEKLDTIIEKVNTSELVQASSKVKLDKLDSDVKELKRSEEKHKDELVKVKISVAEKLGWGAAGGGLISLIVTFIKGSGG
jgi:hypothetical protein